MGEKAALGCLLPVSVHCRGPTLRHSASPLVAPQLAVVQCTSRQGSTHPWIGCSPVSVCPNVGPPMQSLSTEAHGAPISGCTVPQPVGKQLAGVQGASVQGIHSAGSPGLGCLPPISMFVPVNGTLVGFAPLFFQGFFCYWKTKVANFALALQSSSTTHGLTCNVCSCGISKEIYKVTNHTACTSVFGCRIQPE